MCISNAVFVSNAIRRSLALIAVLGLLFVNVAFVYAAPLDVKFDQAYSEGLKAYLNDDYLAAQSLWLQSAKAGNGRSMFNLGLLHEQRKIANADASKADEWYRLAGNAGYVAADYHYALRIIEGGGDHNQANGLFLRAADQGFTLAKEYVNKKGLSADGVAVAGSIPKSTVLDKVVVNDSVERSSKYQTERWIKSKKAHYWTIQMLAFNEESKVQRFIDTNGLITKAAYFKERKSKEVLYKLVYGVYKTKVQADFARQNLPDGLKTYGPWLRSIESVQNVIKAQ